MITYRTFGVALRLGSAAAAKPSKDAAANPPGASSCGDCRKSGFSRPLLYFYWRNTSAANCCERCAANAKCAFSIWQPPNAGGAALGHCCPSPAAASSCHGSGGTTATAAAAAATASAAAVAGAQRRVRARQRWAGNGGGLAVL